MKEYGAEGTFFLVGFWVENFPEKTKAIAENGFEIGTHSNTHPHMSRLSESQINQELTISMNIIEETAGDHLPRALRRVQRQSHIRGIQAQTFDHSVGR